MKSATVISLLTTATFAQKFECQMMCAAIYSVDYESCSCVPIKFMECHPQYNNDCIQADYDEAHGRNPEKNPY